MALLSSRATRNSSEHWPRLAQARVLGWVPIVDLLDRTIIDGDLDLGCFGSNRIDRAADLRLEQRF
jgi:hypothetical protein